MKRFLITRCEGNPDDRSVPSSIVHGCDTIEQAETYILGRDPSYHYQIFTGTCSYNRYVELRKTPIFENNA